MPPVTWPRPARRPRRPCPARSPRSRRRRWGSGPGRGSPGPVAPPRRRPGSVGSAASGWQTPRRAGAGRRSMPTLTARCGPGAKAGGGTGRRRRRGSRGSGAACRRRARRGLRGRRPRGSRAAARPAVRSGRAGSPASCGRRCRPRTAGRRSASRRGSPRARRCRPGGRWSWRPRPVPAPCTRVCPSARRRGSCRRAAPRSPPWRCRSRRPWGSGRPWSAPAGCWPASDPGAARRGRGPRRPPRARRRTGPARGPAPTGRGGPAAPAGACRRRAP